MHYIKGKLLQQLCIWNFLHVTHSKKNSFFWKLWGNEVVVAIIFPRCNENLNNHCTRLRKLFKGENYLREETIRGNMVFAQVTNITNMSTKTMMQCTNPVPLGHTSRIYQERLAYSHITINPCKDTRHHQLQYVKEATQYSHP